MAVGEGEAAERAIEAEGGLAGDQALRAARAVVMRRAGAGGADEIDPLDQDPRTMLQAEQDDARHEVIEIGRAEGARPAHRAPRIAANPHQVQVGLAVDLAAAQEEGVDPALGGAVEQLLAAIGENIVALAAQDRDAQPPFGAHAGEQGGRGWDRRGGADRHMATAGQAVGQAADQQLGPGVAGHAGQSGKASQSVK